MTPRAARSEEGRASRTTHAPLGSAVLHGAAERAACEIGTPHAARRAHQPVGDGLRAWVGPRPSDERGRRRAVERDELLVQQQHRPRVLRAARQPARARRRVDRDLAAATLNQGQHVCAHPVHHAPQRRRRSTAPVGELCCDVARSLVLPLIRPLVLPLVLPLHTTRRARRRGRQRRWRTRFATAHGTLLPQLICKRAFCQYAAPQLSLCGELYRHWRIVSSKRWSRSSRGRLSTRRSIRSSKRRRSRGKSGDSSSDCSRRGRSWTRQNCSAHSCVRSRLRRLHSQLKA